MHVLVTGGRGFQGRHLTRALDDRGHTVTVLATPSARSRLGDHPARIVWGSVTDPIVVRSAIEGQDVIVHMAAMTNPEACAEDPGRAMAVNAGGTQVILEALRGTPHPPALLHVSSCEVYGPVAVGAVQHELAPMVPPTIYGASKCAGDRLVYAYMRASGVRAVIVRPCNVYGPGQRAGPHGGVIPTMVARARAGAPIQIRGDGAQWREYIHVRDIVPIYVALIEKPVTPAHGALNISVGVRQSVGGIAAAIAARTGASVEYVAGRPGEVRGFRLDVSEARSWGLIPDVVTSFDDALDELIADPA